MPLLTNDQLADYSAGWSARCDGHPVAACPHPPGERAAMWMLGWESAHGADGVDDDHDPVIAIVAGEAAHVQAQ